jgi:ubiquinone/menaquinone biosynthesis C-methylase UbiE
MQISATSPIPTYPEPQLFERVLPLDGANIVELGCGRAQLTRLIATTGSSRRILALEVDEIQHRINADIADLPNVRFELAGAQAIPAADQTVDVVLMFKSLHHVPVDLMPKAFSEIRRVLKPGGFAYISEPVFAGDFNEILRLFNDEQRVREQAFAAVQSVVASGQFELVKQMFFNSPVKFEDFAEFERLILGVTHTRLQLSSEVIEEVKRRFDRHLTAQGVRFAQPIRVDLLRRP